MDFEEEFNIFDDCDELFDINDSDDIDPLNFDDDDFLQSLNTLETDKTDDSPTSVIMYRDSERMDKSDNPVTDENSDDNDIFHPSIVLSLHSLIISNFTINTADLCSIALNPITQAICFIPNNEKSRFRLDIHVNGIEKYERIGRLIQLQLRRNVRKWIIPVREVIDEEGNIEISVDPTNGEIFRTDMILATVAIHESFCNLEVMDAVFNDLKLSGSDFFFNLMNTDKKLQVPIIMNYNSLRCQYNVPIQLTLRDFTIIMQNKLSTGLLSGYFEYRYADYGIIGIDDEEDWENFKEVMIKNAICEKIEMWVGKD